MPITRRLAALTLTAVTLGLPAGAQASTVDAHGAVTAGAHAQADVQQARQFVMQAGAPSRAKVHALLVRSRGEVRRATIAAAELTARAGDPAAVDAAIGVDVTLSATLKSDAFVLADITSTTSGRVRSEAAAALVSDMQLQRKLLDASIRLVGQADGNVDQAIAGIRSEQQNVSAEIQAAAEVAGAQSNAQVTASADLAVGIGTQMIAADARRVTEQAASGQAAATSTVQSLLAQLRHTAAGIEATLASTGIAADTLTVSGHGTVTLAALAQLGLEATASARAQHDGTSSSDISVLAHLARR